MPESIGRKLGDALAVVVAKWSVWMAVASFVVYVLGYISLRFRLTALGVGTDLELVDERYLFEGARFLIYLVSAVAVAALAAVPFFLFAWLLSRARPATPGPLQRWWDRQIGPLAIGAVVSVAMIQLVMRQCFRFENLLLREALPEPEWFADLLLSPTDYGQVYFTLLFAGIVVPALSVRALARWATAGPLLRGLGVSLLFLIGVQVMLLPVNYGILMASGSVPRLAKGSGPHPDRTAWLVWEGQRGMTFLMRGRDGQRSLVTLPREKIDQVQIVAYDPLAELRRRVSEVPEREEPRQHSPTRRASEVPGREEPRQHSPTRRTQEPRELVRKVKLNRWDMILGITATPKALRDGTLPVTTGDVCIVPARGGEAQDLTEGGGYSSPIFLPGEEDVLALRGDDLMRVSIDGGSPRKVGTIPGVHKLLGIDPARPQLIFFLGATAVGAFDLSASHRHDVDATPEPKMLRYLRGEERHFGDVRVYVERRSDPLGDWEDVAMQAGGKRPRFLTSGSRRVSNRQPTLSHDGMFVAFVRETR